MKVYVRKEDRQQSLAVNLVVCIVIIIAPLFVYYSFLNHLSQGEDLMNLLSGYAVLLLFATIFFIIGLVYLFIFLKGPRKCKGKLIEKRRVKLFGIDYDYMTFNVHDPKASPDDKYGYFEYKCYTTENNNLTEGCEYTVKVSDFTNDIKSVEEPFDNSIKEKTPAKKSVNIVFLIVGIFFVGLFAISILGLIYYPQYTPLYTIFALFCGGAVFFAYKMFKQ